MSFFIFVGIGLYIYVGFIIGCYTAYHLEDGKTLRSLTRFNVLSLLLTLPFSSVVFVIFYFLFTAESKFSKSKLGKWLSKPIKEK